MAEYYCSPRILSAAGHNPRRLVRLYVSAEDADEDPAQLLVCRADFALLDFNTDAAASALARLLDQSQIYRYALEVLLDAALSAAATEPELERALVPAFGKGHLPEAIASGQKPVDALLGDLKHPLIAHMTAEDLAKVYVSFLRNLTDETLLESWGVNEFISLNPAAFFTQADGIRVHDAVFVRLDKVLAASERPEKTPDVPVDDIIARGKASAALAALPTAAAHLAAWKKADAFQAERCRAIHNALVQGGPRPRWIQNDVFRILEHEAMKQFHAEKLLSFEDGAQLLSGALKKAVELNARGEVSPGLDRLLQETLVTGPGYSGAARIYADSVDKRTA